MVIFFLKSFVYMWAGNKMCASKLRLLVITSTVKNMTEFGFPIFIISPGNTAGPARFRVFGYPVSPLILRRNMTFFIQLT